MALTRTFLTAAIKASDLVLTVNSTATGFPVVGTVSANQPVLVDNEMMFVTGVPNATQLVVRGRGSDGSVAVAHDVNAPVVTSSVVSDFPAIPFGHEIIHPLTLPDQTSYGQSGAITVPVKDTKVFLSGSVAQAMTLAAPSLGSNGIELFVSSQTAFAHTVVATALFDNGAAGAPFTTATFVAQPGSSMLLMAQNGLWNVIAVNGVTFA